MKKSTYVILSAAIVGATVSVTWLIVKDLQRPAQMKFAVRTVRAQSASVTQALNLGGMTRGWGASEGGCGQGGCNGGVLAQMPPSDLKEFVPALPNYNEETNAVIWLYQIKPSQIIRHNTGFGQNGVTIRGKLTSDKNFYFALVPREAVAPSEWMRVELH